MIKETLIDFASSIPPELGVFFLSMMPVTELRASIPIGIEVFNLPVATTWILAILGDMVPSFFLLLLFPKVHDWLIKQKFLGTLITKKLASAEKAFAGKYQKYGSLALVLFVAIPLPFTGAWTGSFASFVFNIPFRKSFPLIFCGVVIAGTLVTLLTLFAGEVVRGIFL